MIHLVEYSFDYDDFRDRDDRGLFDEREFMRERDLRDEIARERRLLELDRMQNERDRAMREAAKLQETKIEELQQKDLVEAINNPLIEVTPEGRISSKPIRPMPSGRDVIRRSGQFSRANLLMGQTMPKKKRKKNKKHCKNLSTCLRQANAELRTKKGKLRKGKTQADVMRRAQRLLRKMK